jgi:hypothetical protein
MISGQPSIVACFGEAGKGEYRTAYYCRTLAELEEFLGGPPPQTKGLFFAVQALLYQYPLIYFRVREEGFSVSDYLTGLFHLKNQELPFALAAIGIPGVGSEEIVQAALPLCETHHSILLTSEADLYDYLTL